MTANAANTGGTGADAPPGAARQRTLREAVGRRGVALHAGRECALTLRPAPPDHGVVFRRTDVSGADPSIPARWDRVAETRLCTTLGNEAGVAVSTVEHLMAALAGCGVDNALVEVEGPELPILDGSAAPFVAMIREAGVAVQPAPRHAIEVLRPVRVEDGSASLSVEPAPHFSIDFGIEFASPAIGRSRLDIRLANGAFNEWIGPARTFGLLEEVEGMRAAGFGLGGSVENAIVIDGGRVVNEGGLRFDDEFVRHKILDCVGDLYLAGAPLLGRVTARKSGHALNNRLLRELFADSGAWRRVPIAEGSLLAA